MKMVFDYKNCLIEDNISSLNCSFNIDLDFDQPSETLPQQLVKGNNFYAYFTPVLIVTGLVGNSLSLAVFITKNMRKLSASTYLAALSVSDMSALLFYVFIEWLRRGLVHINPESKLDFLDKNGFCHVLLFLSYISRLMSSWIIVVFTIERFTGVCYPLRALRTNSGKILVGLLLTACLLVLYKPALSGENTLRGRTACATRTHFKFALVVLDLIFAFLITLIPFVIITVLNCVIVRKLFQRNYIHADLFAEGSQIKLEFTLILFAISFFFIAFSLPFVTAWSRYYFLASDLAHVPDKTTDTDYWVGVLTITRPIFYMHYSVNFFLYSITGAYFRNELAVMLRIRKKSRIFKSHIRCVKFGSSSTQITTSTGFATYEA